jgi:hypothetical protein
MERMKAANDKKPRLATWTGRQLQLGSQAFKLAR